MACVHGFKTAVISAPGPPCLPYNYAGAFIPTARGLIYTGAYCKRDLYELRGNSIQSLNWIKLNEKLYSRADTYTVAYPLPTELDVTCT